MVTVLLKLTVLMAFVAKVVMWLTVQVKMRDENELIEFVKRVVLDPSLGAFIRLAPLAPHTEQHHPNVENVTNETPTLSSP